MYEKLQPDKILGDSFAKTINYHGIHSNFCLDIPEIIEEEKRQQERRNDIAKFTKLAISDCNSEADMKLIEKLFDDEQFMLSYTDEIIGSLASDSRFLNDIGLL